MCSTPDKLNNINYDFKQLTVLYSLFFCVITQWDPMPTHTIEKDQIFYTAFYSRIWIPNLNKDKDVDIYRAFL